ncbi:MAG: bifunctional metallophosphatase/5'-nucleotidase [Thermoanaerobaculia bacterium]|nr:bifunctional metallophosphatase/5'-nucleotidase [Thermoanaerobaculia bacterium]
MARIFVDLDDVLAQTGRMFLAVLEEEFGRRVELEEMRSYHLGESLGLDDTGLGEFLAATHRPERLLSIEPMPGAADALAAWIAAGHEVVVVTGRPPGALASTRGWLARWRIPHTELHLLDKYSDFYDGAHGTPEGVWSLDDLARQGFVFAVEDFPGTARHLAEELAVPVALFDRPWNRGVREDARLARCRSWAEVRRRFAALP